MSARPLLLIVLGLVAGVAAWFWQPWQEGGRKRLFAMVEASQAASDGGLSASAVISDAKGGLEADIVVRDLSLPWDLAFLGDSEILVTEKGGSLWRIDLGSGERRKITGTPDVRVQGQGGLHAVLLHPKFSDNGLIYLSYAAAGEDGKGAVTHFMRARLDGTRLTEQKLLLRTKAPGDRGQHFGGAMVFDRDGYLFVSVGERGYRDDAQKLSSHNGKILRLHDDGSVPKDNPLVDTPGALPEIWSYGHRNPQGLALDPVSGRIYEAEHGPQGGDEINVIERGRNYGWPVITYGREYGTGIRIGEGTTRPDIVPPLHYYVPSIATAGIAYYAGDAFPQWKNSLFVAALRGHLNRVQLNPDGTFAKEERLLSDRDLRIRAVRVSPKGALFVVADDGVILQVSAKP
ncbi:glucose/arabinose dehydrogenase [Panacagrimonas perspica]|uniref:Glucose/arabinose dehydrogenase n=1 Tax=Panacagrimonas perspica TaxID=381431 RepID=A0A4R7P4L3_9GAMM|nr:PQQ-dependent sugar dehydrogenase [Panacagrimonas perspica]TDU28339.1 glucose/arabinose dehydrogenase [Panacagrimonas perspica]